jgi:hypothetical protein
MPFGGQILGTSVALDGDLAVAGAPEYFGDPYGNGRAFVYRETLTGYRWEATLGCSITGLGSTFGSSVATDQNWLLAGAPRNQIGVCFFFYYGISWSESQSFEGGGCFGTSVDLQGSHAVVGDNDADTVDVYRLNAGVWSLQQQLTGPDGSFFGHSLCLDGSRLAVGSPFVKLGTLYVGSVMMFDRVAGQWTATQVLPSLTGGSTAGLFGWDVALANGVLVIGDPWVNPGARSASGSST